MGPVVGVECEDDLDLLPFSKTLSAAKTCCLHRLDVESGEEPTPNPGLIK